MGDVSVRSEATPNPNARRFLVDRTVQEQPKGRFFSSPEQADDPLARSLFELEGVAAVMLLPASVTVTKTASASWDVVDEGAQRTIQQHFA
jgi:hypothetical protein